MTVQICFNKKRLKTYDLTKRIITSQLGVQTNIKTSRFKCSSGSGRSSGAPGRKPVDYNRVIIILDVGQVLCRGFVLLNPLCAPDSHSIITRRCKVLCSCSGEFKKKKKFSAETGLVSDKLTINQSIKRRQKSGKDSEKQKFMQAKLLF